MACTFSGLNCLQQFTATIFLVNHSLKALTQLFQRNMAEMVKFLCRTDREQESKEALSPSAMAFFRSHRDTNARWLSNQVLT